jgi:TonB family protein
MKTLLAILLLSLSLGTRGQSADSSRTSDEPVYTIVEEMPEFPGGIRACYKYISEQVKYPELARELAIGGKVFLKFMLDEQGDIVSCDVVKSSGFQPLDEEAMRVVRSMPRWSPGKQNGRSVKVYFNLPIIFHIDGPCLVFNTSNKNEKYRLAKEAIIAKDNKLALSYYEADPGDVDAWYNMAVLHFYKKNKREAKRYFELVVANVTNRESQIYKLADSSLRTNF